MDEMENTGAVNVIRTEPNLKVLSPSGKEFMRVTSDAVYFPRDQIVLEITSDGRLELGEGASVDEATKVLFDLLAESMNNRVAAVMRKNQRYDEVLRLIPEALDDHNYIDIRMMVKHALKGDE